MKALASMLAVLVVLSGCAGMEERNSLEQGMSQSGGNAYKYTYQHPKKLQAGGYYVCVREEASDVMRLRWVIKEISTEPLNRTGYDEILYVSPDLRTIQPAWRFIKPMVGKGEDAMGPYRIFVCDDDGYLRHADRYSPCNSGLMTQTRFGWTGVNYRIKDEDYNKGYRNGVKAGVSGPVAHFYRIDERKLDRILAETDLIDRLGIRSARLNP